MILEHFASKTPFTGKGSHLLVKKNRRRQPGDRILASKGKGSHFLTKKNRRRQPGDRNLAPGDQKYGFFKKSGNGFPWCGKCRGTSGEYFGAI